MKKNIIPFARAQRSVKEVVEKFYQDLDEIEEIVIIAKDRDGEWIFANSELENELEWIGSLYKFINKAILEDGEDFLRQFSIFVCSFPLKKKGDHLGRLSSLRLQPGLLFLALGFAFQGLDPLLQVVDLFLHLLLHGATFAPLHHAALAHFPLHLLRGALARHHTGTPGPIWHCGCWGAGQPVRPAARSGVHAGPGAAPGRRPAPGPRPLPAAALRLQ